MYGHIIINSSKHLEHDKDGRIYSQDDMLIRSEIGSIKNQSTENHLELLISTINSSVPAMYKIGFRNTLSDSTKNICSED